MTTWASCTSWRLELWNYCNLIKTVCKNFVWLRPSICCCDRVGRAWSLLFFVWQKSHYVGRGWRWWRIHTRATRLNDSLMKHRPIVVITHRCWKMFAYRPLVGCTFRLQATIIHFNFVEYNYCWCGLPIRCSCLSHHFLIIIYDCWALHNSPKKCSECRAPLRLSIARSCVNNMNGLWNLWNAWLRGCTKTTLSICYMLH